MLSTRSIYRMYMWIIYGSWPIAAFSFLSRSDQHERRRELLPSFAWYISLYFPYIVFPFFVLFPCSLFHDTSLFSRLLLQFINISFMLIHFCFRICFDLLFFYFIFCFRCVWFCLYLNCYLKPSHRICKTTKWKTWQAIENSWEKKKILNVS